MDKKQETVRLEHLQIGYSGSKGNRKIVAGDLNACLVAGELVCLIGSNGIGKSTLLQTLCGFLPKQGGSIYLNGREIGTYTDKELSHLVSVVLTARPDLQNMTVAALVGMGRSPYTGFWGRLSRKDIAIVEEALRMVGITSLSDRMVQALSDGERQKVMIAKALAQQTPVVYLDEPTAFLDYPSKVDMMQLLYDLCQETGKTIFLSTHDLELALQIADKIWLMERNSLRIGSPRQLADSGALAHFIERDGIRFDAAGMRILIASRTVPHLHQQSKSSAVRPAP